MYRVNKSPWLAPPPQLTQQQKMLLLQGIDERTFPLSHLFAIFNECILFLCVGLCKFIRLFLITARFVLYSSILIFAHHLSNRQIGSKTWIRGNYMLNIRFRFGNILLFFFFKYLR